jgi:hypothetical protein
MSHQIATVGNGLSLYTSTEGEHFAVIKPGEKGYLLSVRITSTQQLDAYYMAFRATAEPLAASTSAVGRATIKGRHDFYLETDFFLDAPFSEGIVLAASATPDVYTPAPDNFYFTILYA